MKDLHDRLDRLQYQVRLLSEGIDFSDHPIPVLVVSLDWGEYELKIANDIFEKYDNEIEMYKEVNWTAFEHDFESRLSVGYQNLKIVVLAFYRNSQWTRVCFEYAKAYPCAEFDEILNNAPLGINSESLRTLARKQFSSLPVSRNSQQIPLVLNHLLYLGSLPYYSIDDLQKALIRTTEARSELAKKYPPKSGIDQIVRAMVFENPGYVVHAFPKAESSFQTLIEEIRKHYSLGEGA